MILIFLMITVFETCRFSHNAFTGCRGSKNINTDLNFRRRSKLATLSLERTFLSTQLPSLDLHIRLFNINDRWYTRFLSPAVILASSLARHSRYDREASCSFFLTSWPNKSPVNSTHDADKRRGTKGFHKSLLTTSSQSLVQLECRKYADSIFLVCAILLQICTCHLFTVLLNAVFIFSIRVKAGTLLF